MALFSFIGNLRYLWLLTVGSMEISQTFLFECQQFELVPKTSFKPLAKWCLFVILIIWEKLLPVDVV